MDAGNTGNTDRSRQLGARRDTMLGSQTYLGLLLAIFTFLRIVWSIASRFLLQYLAQYGGAVAVARFSSLNAVVSTAFFALAFAVLYILAARAALFRPHGILFAVCAAGELLRLPALFLVPLLSGQDNPGLLLNSIFVPVSLLCLAAAFLIFAVSRETPRDVRILAWFIAPLYVLSLAATLAVYFAAWMLLSGSLEPWQRLLAYGNMAVFFISLILGALSGLCFLLMRTPLPKGEYPAAEGE